MSICADTYLKMKKYLKKISKLLLDLAYDKIIKLLMILLMKKCLKIPSGF